MNKLSLLSRKALLEIKQQLNTEQYVLKSSKNKGMQELHAWCSYHDLSCDLAFNATQLKFSADTLAQIEAGMAELGLLPLEKLGQNTDRYTQAELSKEEQKHLGSKPRDFRILCWQKKPEPLSSSANLIIDKDVRQLQVSRYSSLVFIENLDTFYQLAEQHQLPDDSLFDRPLVLYRGDMLYSKGAKQARQLFQQQQKPCVYLGDFDIAGLHIAIHWHCSHLLLPPIERLLTLACKEYFSSQQLSQYDSVAAFAEHQAMPEQSQAAFQILLEEQRALLQQGFEQTLACYPLQKP